MFPADTFRAMQESANKADFKTVRHDHSVHGQVVYADGSRDKFEIEPPRQHQLLSVDDIGRFVDYCQLLGSQRQSVWVSPDGCQVLMRDHASSTREDIGSLTFQETPLFTLIRGLNAPMGLGGPPLRYTQAQIVRMFRSTLYDAFVDDNERNRWLGRFKALTQTTTLDRGSASQKVTGADPLETWPDFLTLHTRVYDDPVLESSALHAIRVVLELDPATKLFELIPLQSHINRAVRAEVAELTQHIRSILSEETFVFQGRPSDPSVCESDDDD